LIDGDAGGAAREVSGFAPLRNGFIHESRRSESVANNGDFGETKADFRCVLLGHEKSHVLPPGTRARRRWIRFIKASGFMSAVSATSSTAAVWMSPLGGRSPFARMRASPPLPSARSPRSWRICCPLAEELQLAGFVGGAEFLQQQSACR
jgi:hypothetical protein